LNGNIEKFWTDTDDVRTLIGALASQFESIQVDFTWRPQLRDPNDEMVLDCAVNAQANAIVTFNKRDFLPNATQFGIEILSPGEFIKRLQLKERLKQ